MQQKGKKEMKDEASSSSDGDGAVLEITRSKDIPPAHYTLKINSFSQLSEIVRKTQEGKYESSDFDVGGYKWKLLLYPNGNAKRNGNGHISLYLALADTSMISDGSQIDVRLKFFVYDQIQDKYLTIQDGKVKRYHALKIEHGFDQLISLAMFNDPCNGYIVDDCCAFGVEVHVIKRTAKGEKISFTRNPRNGTYTWRLKKFSTLSLSSYDSEIFVAANYKWKLSVYPEGDSRQKGKSLSLFLYLDDSSALLKHAVYVVYTLMVKDQVLGKHHERKGGAWFDTSSTSRGLPNFMLLSDLHDASKGFLVNDTLIIEVKIALVSAVQYRSRN